MGIQDITGAKVFLGCFVKRLSCSLGFNGEPSTLELDLVEGNAGNTTHNSLGASGWLESRARPGTFHKFDWAALKFVGMVQTWTHSYSTQGEIYNVKLVDPRIAFSNIPIILNSLGFTTGIRFTNCLNAFDYYGSPSHADSTENGMTFSKIKDYLETTGIIDLYGTRFRLSFSTGFIPNSGTVVSSGIPTWYRLNNGQASLDQIISQTCTDMNMDWYASIDYSTFNPTGISTIKIIDIPRYTSVTGIGVKAFISGATQSGTLISYQHGQELRPDSLNVLLKGAAKTFWHTPGTAEIKNYWGRTDDGSALTTDYNESNGIVLLDNIKASGSSVLEPFTISAPRYFIQRDVNSNVYPPQLTKSFSVVDITGYRPSVNTMRAALHSQKAFEAMLYVDHLSLAQAIGLRSHPVLDGQNYILLPEVVKFGSKLSIINSGTVYVTQAHKALIQAVYEATKSTVEQWWGKAWLAPLPQSTWLQQGTYDNSEFFARIEYGISDTAWGENISYPSGITNHPVLLGSTNPTFKDDLGRTRAFISLNNFGGAYSSDFPYYLDMSRDTRNTLVEQGNKLVIPCNIQQYELDPDSAIVTIDNPIEGISVSGYYGYENQKEYFEFLRAVGYTDANITGYFLQLNTYDHKEYGLERPRIYQLKSVQGNYGIHIPLQSNCGCFGPYLASGNINGPINVISDDSLAPWTYGSYAKMDIAGQQLCNRAASSIYIIDFGNLAIAGLPEYNMGDRIGDNANITAMSIQLGTEGLTTNYSLKTFALPIGRLSKLLTDRISRVYNDVQYAKRQIIEVKDEKEEFNKNRLTDTKKITESSDLGIGMLLSYVPQG